MIGCCATRFRVAEDGAVFRSTGAPSALPAVNDILPLPGQIPSGFIACCCAGELPLSPTPEGIFHAAGSIKNYIFGRALHGLFGDDVEMLAVGFDEGVELGCGVGCLRCRRDCAESLDGGGAVARKGGEYRAGILCLG